MKNSCNSCSSCSKFPLWIIVSFLAILAIIFVANSVSAYAETQVTITVYASSPNCVDNETCYSPSELTTLAGSNVTWLNDSGVIHTVTSGNPLEGSDGTFDSSIIMSGDTFSHTFTEAGNYQYFCTVHPWMTGTIIVE